MFTCVNTNSELKICLWFVFDWECFDGLNHLESHASNLSGVVATIPHRQS